MDLLKTCGKIVHRIEQLEIESTLNKFVNELIEHCPNLTIVSVRFSNRRCDDGQKLGHEQFLKLARIRVEKSASFIFEDRSSFEQAEQVFDGVYPNGNGKINFYKGCGPDLPQH